MAPKVSDALIDSDQTFASPEFTTLLDPRLLRALADLKFASPTLVQAKAIPLLLNGTDVLARARTGSGKTGAYAIPLVQRVLEVKSAYQPSSPEYQHTRAVVLVPTRELAIQVTNFIKKLTTYCEGFISVVNVAAGGANVQRVLLNDNPDIIVSTPSKLLSLLQSKDVELSYLIFLAIDEADLILSYGHKDDLTRIMDPAMGWIPKLGVQACLMSATLSEEINTVKGLILRKPAILTLSEPVESSSLLTQYYTHTSERDKFLLIYVLLKLKLIRGKSIVFVNDIERGYRVKLFLERFGIKTCVVNSELPLASRYHVVEEFNRGVYDVVVATDEGGGEELDAEEEEEREERGEGEEGEEAAEGAEGEVQEDSAESAEPSSEAGPSKRRASPPPPSSSTRSSKRRKPNTSSSLARGIDFTSASSVINFDLPTSPNAYLHRIGRTARAGHTGLALSFIVPRSLWGKDKGVSLRSAEHDEDVWKRIKSKVEEGSGGSSQMKEWDWGGRKGEIEGFRYRMEDALRAVTAKRVADARKEEVRRELLNSEKLKAHFAANPLDLAYLRHDAPIHTARQASHLKHVPGYLMPKIAAIPSNPIGGVGGDVGDDGHVRFAKRASSGAKGGRSGARGRRGGKGGSKKVDPLKFKG